MKVPGAGSDTAESTPWPLKLIETVPLACTWDVRETLIRTSGRLSLHDGPTSRARPTLKTTPRPHRPSGGLPPLAMARQSHIDKSAAMEPGITFEGNAARFQYSRKQ